MSWCACTHHFGVRTLNCLRSGSKDESRAGRLRKICWLFLSASQSRGNRSIMDAKEAGTSPREVSCSVHKQVTVCALPGTKQWVCWAVGRSCDTGPLSAEWLKWQLVGRVWAWTETHAKGAKHLSWPGLHPRLWERGQSHCSKTPSPCPPPPLEVCILMTGVLTY